MPDVRNMMHGDFALKIQAREIRHGVYVGIIALQGFRNDAVVPPLIITPPGQWGTPEEAVHSACEQVPMLAEDGVFRRAMLLRESTSTVSS